MLTKALCSTPGEEVDTMERMQNAVAIVVSGFEEQGTGELAPWIHEVLSQCELFNAILDIPDVTEYAGEEALYCTVLKSAEFHLAKLDDASSIVQVVVGVDSNYEDSSTSLLANDTPGSASRHSQQVSLFCVDATCKNGRIVRCRKTVKQFHELHCELIQTHAIVRDFDFPTERWYTGKFRQEDAQKYSMFLTECVGVVMDLTTQKMQDVSHGLDDSEDRPGLVETYLIHLQEVNLDRTLRNFLGIETEDPHVART